MMVIIYQKKEKERERYEREVEERAYPCGLLVKSDKAPCWNTFVSSEAANQQ